MLLRLIVVAALFLWFEIWQLVISERYLGIRQIARNGDPRKLGLREGIAFCWSVVIFAYWLWMFTLLATRFTRIHAICFLAVSAIGFSLRRNTSIKWVLVILTFEGAIRIGLLVSLIGIAWRRM